VIGHQYHGGLDLDASGRLVTSYSGHSSTHLVTGPHSTSDSFAAGAAYAESGVSSSLTGDVLWAISEHAAWRARRLSSTLAAEWTLTRGRTVEDFGTGLSNLTASADGHLALVGEYVGFAPGSFGMTQLGWVQVFAP
jgi:hypothetical protein